MPRPKESIILNLLSNFNATATSKVVENSANPFIEEPTSCPLRARMATKALMDVTVYVRSLCMSSIDVLNMNRERPAYSVAVVYRDFLGVFIIDNMGNTQKIA